MVTEAAGSPLRINRRRDHPSRKKLRDKPDPAPRGKTGGIRLWILSIVKDINTITDLKILSSGVLRILIFRDYGIVPLDCP